MANNLRVVVAAAGKGTRMKSGINKQYMLLNSRPVLSYSLDFFEQMEIVEEIVVITGENELDYCEHEVIRRYNYKKVSAVLPGGKERQDSVLAGLHKLGADTNLVAVHDGARPLLSSGVFFRLVKEAEEWGAAVPGIASKDTLKMVDSQGIVSQTMDRSIIFAVQTPQIFRYAELSAAYQKAYEDNFMGTDDASLFERYIGQVKVVEGDYNNLKITTPEDLVIAEALLKSQRK